jgi:hypothetical protein
LLVLWQCFDEIMHDLVSATDGNVSL